MLRFNLGSIPIEVRSSHFLIAALFGWSWMAQNDPNPTSQLLGIAIGGFFLQSTLPVNVTFGQSIAPVSAATVSSLMMGFAWGTGGLTVPIVGLIADRIGIEATLRGLALVPIAAAVCALPLPGRARVSAPARPADLGVPEP